MATDILNTMLHNWSLETNMGHKSTGPNCAGHRWAVVTATILFQELDYLKLKFVKFMCLWHESDLKSQNSLSFFADLSRGALCNALKQILLLHCCKSILQTESSHALKVLRWKTHKVLILQRVPLLYKAQLLVPY